MGSATTTPDRKVLIKSEKMKGRMLKVVFGTHWFFGKMVKIRRKKVVTGITLYK